MANKIHIVHFLILFIILLIPKLSFPQNKDVRFEHIAVEDGLSQGQVFCIVQDTRGFMWFGTGDGLNKYDGYSITVYKHDPQDLQSLTENTVYSIYEDQTGMLWIGTDGGGLNKFDRVKETFTHYKHKPDDSQSLSNNVITSIYKDQTGVLWIGTYGGGLNKLALRDNEGSPPTFVHYKHDPNNAQSLSDNKVFSIYEDLTGMLWIGTDGGGLNKFDREKETFVHYKHDPDDPQSLSDNIIYSIYEDQSGVIWIGTESGGLNMFDVEKETFVHYKHDPDDPQSLSANRIHSIYEDHSGTLWIGTYGGGLNKFDWEEETFFYYKHRSNNPKSLSGNDVRSIYEDQTGVIWIGTDGGGLNKFNQEKESFVHYKHDPNDPQSLSDNTVFSFYEDQTGVIWIGTGGGGLNKFDREKGTFVHYKHDPDDPQSISGNIVYPVCEDRTGALWIGTYRGGLDKFDQEKGTFVHYKHDPNDPQSLSNDIVTSINKDHSGVIWIGTYGGGLNKLVPSDKKEFPPTFVHYKYDPDNPNSLSDNIIVAQIYEDQTGVLWIGTGDGLNKFDREKETFVHYKHDPEDPQSLSSNRILSIFEDKSGVLWIGTYSGLNKFDPASETFQQFGEKDGLPNNVIYGILEDDNRNLWLSTNKGLSKFDLQTKKFRNFDIKDGLQENEFNSDAYYKSKDGNMFFGGVNGFNIFHPDSIKYNPHIPTIVITNFQIFNKSVSIFKGNSSEEGVDSRFIYKHISEIDELILSYQQSVFSFEFSSLDYTSPEKNKYAYMMEGFDKDWNYTNADRRFVTYTNLDPGEYTFRVKGSNNDGIWNEEGTSIGIIILPPWWATTWAYIFYTFIIISIVYFTWKMQLKRIRIKHNYEMSKFEAEKMHEIDEMKSRFFANISHEFRTPLTLIFGPAKDVLEKTDDPYTKKNVGIIKRNASRLYGLVNQLLDLSKLEAGKMTLETREQNIIPLLKGLVLSFTSLSERKKITLKFNTIEENFNVYIDKDKVEKIITNLLSNAFKFTPEGGRIDFTVEKLINEAKMSISDNGVGIPKDRIDKIFDRFFQVDGSHTRESEGTGIGLALTKELVELHKGTIKVESKEGEGTTFTVLLPLGKDHFKPEEIIEKEAKVDVEGAIEATDLVTEDENRKEKADINALLDTDKPLLLIVEDNSDVRKYIISHLEEDYRIQEAVDGEDGLQEALKHIPDLIISDVMMPKMDGFELCEKLKTDERTSHIPIILLTAKATSQDKIEGYETGADDYIMKPFDAKELMVRIKNLIEQRKKLREHFLQEGIFKLDSKNITSVDKKFLEKAVRIINEHISDTSFGVDSFAEEIAISRSQLHRKLIALVGESPGDLIRRERLTTAAKLIEENFGNISEIAIEVGFSNPANFAQCFRKQFGLSPSDYKGKSAH